MIRAFHLRGFVLGLAAILIAGVALTGVISLLSGSLTWGTAFTALLVIMWALFGVMSVLRSLPKLTVTSEGMRQVSLGRWSLAWHDVLSMHTKGNALVIEPAPDALRRQSIREAARWSRFFAGGKHPRNSIVLPRARIDPDAAQILHERQG